MTTPSRLGWMAQMWFVFKQYVNPWGFALWLIFFLSLLFLIGCSVSSIDASTSKALDACKELKDEDIRADCIVRVAETDPDNE